MLALTLLVVSKLGVSETDRGVRCRRQKTDIEGRQTLPHGIHGTSSNMENIQAHTNKFKLITNITCNNKIMNLTPYLDSNE